MKKLYAPWRTKYTKQISTSTDKSGKKSCVFCKQFAQKKDASHYILGRFAQSIILLNLFPYNAGHLLILPKRHCATLAELSESERNEIMTLLTHSTAILEKTLHNQGTNIGINLGLGSGGSLPDHLHFHIVPRWVNDTNFLTAVTQEVKTISFDLNEIYKILEPHFKLLKI